VQICGTSRVLHTSEKYKTNASAQERSAAMIKKLPLIDGMLALLLLVVLLLSAGAAF
jgi:hypothetical protein